MNIGIEPHFSSFYSYMVNSKRLVIMQPEGIGGPAPFHIDIRDMETDKSVGILNGFYFVSSRMDYIKMDDESSDGERIAAAVCGKSGKIREKYAWMPRDAFGYKNGEPYVVILEHLEINKDYRNRGIGTSVMEAIPRILQCELRGMVSTILLLASAYELLGNAGLKGTSPWNPAYEDATRKLVRLYQNLGFRKAGDNVMYYKPDGRRKQPLKVDYE